MEELNKLIEVWENHRDKAKTFSQDAIMNGATKREQSANDAYIKTFNQFINDLYELRKKMPQ
jgi:hypothetical protein